MTSLSDARRRLDTLAQVALRLTRTAPSGRILLAQLAVGLDPEWLVGPWGEELCAELGSAHAAATEPLPFKRIESSLRAAWGGRPRDELDDLERDPVAVTPTSQVHRATLDGAPVAVKVLRPGLARTVGQDLAVLESLQGPLTAAFPALDGRGVLREITERVRDELDLEHEAEVQRRFHRALRGHPQLSVPAPVMRLCGAEVLVSAWVEGTPLAEAPADAVEEAAEALVTFVLGGGVTLGMMHAGLVADDVRLLEDGRLAVLDFGTVAPVDRGRLAVAVLALDALRADDAGSFATSVAELGWLPPETAPAALALLRDALGELLRPGLTRLDTPAVLAARGRLVARSPEVLELLRVSALAPADLWPARAAAQLFAALARVGARARFAEVAAGALRDGWRPDGEDA